VTTTNRSAIPGAEEPDFAARIYHWIVIFVATVMTIDLAIFLYSGLWQTAFLTLAIMAVILAPTLLGVRLPVKIPPEIQVLALLFVFAALFLGEIQRYYDRIPWWDQALHVSSGLLLGILGFLLVYVLNANKRIDLHLQPSFVALFAFLFAVSVGTLWEIFEFAMDTLFGLNMQKAKFGDPSGLTDTMWDLFIDVLGALVISVYGWWYMNDPEQSFIERWIEKFIARNPGLFKR
jgi:uncharacterized membrane protein YjdF